MAMTFITGAAKSGKSRLAMSLAYASRKNVTYVATAPSYADDAEWNDRIERHRAERPPFWKTIETAADPRIELSSLCESYGSEDLLLIDSLGTWIADELFHAPAAQLLERGSALIAGLRTARCSSIVVSEETGWGIVPEYPSGRLFRDILGRLNQQFARAADVSYLAVAGYALDLKNGMPIVDFAPSDLVPQAHDVPHHNH